jgi:hypothetical protein
MKLQDNTDDFLESLSTSYISDFITGKVGINRNVEYNETNINNVIGSFINKFFSKCSRLSKTLRRR